MIDTRTNQLLRTFDIQPFAQKVSGIAPTAAELSSDGATLFLACGGINAVAVVDTSAGRLRGLIPTAWYPNSLSLSDDGKRIAIGSLLDAGSAWRDEPNKRFVHSYRGAVNVLDIPDASQLASYSAAVAENNRMNTAAPAQRDRTKTPVAIPARAGEPSLIEHVVFVIKENRTYDQVFGDLKQGNGDPSLVMFGDDVTPNQHLLAQQFVLLDNFYATGKRFGKGLLVPVGAVNPMLPDWREDIRRCHETFAMPALRLHPNYHGYTLDLPVFAELLRIAERRNLIIQLVVQMEDERTQHPLLRVSPVGLGRLTELVQSVPHLKFQLLNSPRLHDSGVCMDFAMVEGVYGLARLIESGVSRVMFGSYYPFFPVESSLLKVKESGTVRSDDVLFKNARRFRESK